MSIHIIDYIIIGVFLVVPVIISVGFSRRQDSTNRYFTAGGSLPSWAIGISILATLISSVTFLAYPGEGFKNNWILLVQGLMVPITLIFFIKFVVPLYRKVIKISAYEYFEQRFGFLARLYSSLGFFLAHFSKMGTVFFLIAMALSKMVGLEDVNTMIWIIGITVIIITLLGGIEAVVWLDVIQGFLLIIGGIITIILILSLTPGGISAIWDVAAENNRIGFGPVGITQHPLHFDFVNLTLIVMILNGIFYAIQKYGTDQTIVQRYLTARSDKAAIKASLIGVLASVPVWALFMFIGTALFAYYQITSAALPPDITPEGVFPHFIMTQFPPGLIGLVLSALLAAAISSLDSDLNCLSAICVEDYYSRFKPKSSEKQRMNFSRLIVVLAGFAAILIAMYYVKKEGKGVLGIVFTLYSIFSGGIAGLFLLGIFCKRANKKGIYIGLAACVIFTGYAILTSTPFDFGEEKKLLIDMGSLNFTHHKMMLGVYSHIVLFVVGYIASLFFKNEKDIIPLTYAGWKMYKNEQG